MAYIPKSDSVVAFQSNPIKLLTHASVSGNINVAGSVVAYAMGNQSVSGTVGASIIGLPYFGVAGSVATIQNTDPWKVNVPTPSYIAYQLAGSILATSATVVPSANQSVSGQVEAVIVGGSITTVGGTTGNSSVQVVNFPTNQSVSGSVGFVGTPSISGAVTVVGNPSISGTINIGIIPGSVVAFPTGNQSVSGTVGTSIVGGLYRSNTGFAASVHSGIPMWGVRNESNVDFSGSDGHYIPIAVDAKGHTLVSQTEVIDVMVRGSVASAPMGNQSVSGTIGASIIGLPYFGSAGSVAAVQVTSPWVVNMPSSSVIAYQLAGSVLATSATVNMGNSSVQVLNFPTNQSVSGTVGITGNPSISGTVIIGNQQTGVSSVQLMAGINNAGSITAIQGTNPWVIGSNNNSILTAGTYIEDVAHTFGDRGTYTLAVRNDTLASVTTASGDYSPFAVGPSGETIVANAPITKWKSAVTSVMAGPSVLVFSAPGASIFNYVSGVQLTNPGTVAAHVAFYEGLGAVPASILFFAIAPAGGGTNMVFPNPIKTILADKNISASVSAHSSVYVMMEGFTANQLT